MPGGEKTPIAKIKEWAQMIIALVAIAGIVVSASGAFFMRWSEWRLIPERLRVVEDSYVVIADTLEFDRPEVVEFKGSGIVRDRIVSPGDTLYVTYVLRRNVPCETSLTVRFYNHDKASLDFINTYTIPATKSPVSSEYSAFSVGIRIPEELEDGVYSYLPLLKPLQCGVYKEIIPPMSEKFTVRREE